MGLIIKFLFKGDGWQNHLYLIAMVRIVFHLFTNFIMSFYLNIIMILANPPGDPCAGYNAREHIIKIPSNKYSAE